MPGQPQPEQLEADEVTDEQGQRPPRREPERRPRKRARPKPPVQAGSRRRCRRAAGTAAARASPRSASQVHRRTSAFGSRWGAPLSEPTQSRVVSTSPGGAPRTGRCAVQCECARGTRSALEPPRTAHASEVPPQAESTNPAPSARRWPQSRPMAPEEARGATPWCGTPSAPPTLCGRWCPGRPMASSEARGDDAQGRPPPSTANRND